MLRTLTATLVDVGGKRTCQEGQLSEKSSNRLTGCAYLKHDLVASRADHVLTNLRRASLPSTIHTALAIKIFPLGKSGFELANPSN
jgi:hypothetical protein